MEGKNIIFKLVKSRNAKLKIIYYIFKNNQTSSFEFAMNYNLD